ncbi:MAG: hypothetical protein IKI97_11540 [Clostridia bacterium]|nr:hypothetical protein [Clostridia bacterium]
MKVFSISRLYFTISKNQLQEVELKKLNFSMLASETLVPQGFQRGGGGEIGVFSGAKMIKFFKKKLLVS